MRPVDAALVVVALAASFLVVEAAFVAFFAEALAVVFVVLPVAAFLAGVRLEVVFLVVAVAFGLPASVFFGEVFVAVLVEVFFAGAAFFVVAAALGVAVFLVVVVGLLVLVVAFALVADDFAETFALVVLAFAVFFSVVVLGFGLVAVFLAAGLFSFASASAALALGASLTRPEGPFGRTKTPFSLPVLSALANCVF